MAKSPPTLQILPIETTEKEQLKAKINELIRRLDEAYRFLKVDIAAIEKRLDDGGL